MLIQQVRVSGCRARMSDKQVITVRMDPLLNARLKREATIERTSINKLAVARLQMPTIQTVNKLQYKLERTIGPTKRMSVFDLGGVCLVGFIFNDGSDWKFMQNTGCRLDAEAMLEIAKELARLRHGGGVHFEAAVSA